MNGHSLTKTVSGIVREQLIGLQEITLHVISDSMAPTIVVGDRVLVSAVTSAGLIPGDIVLFAKGDYLYTHRFVRAVEDGTIITKGDRLKNFDLPLAQHLLVGKVNAIYHGNVKNDLRHGWHRWLNWLYGKLLLIQWLLVRTDRNINQRFPGRCCALFFKKIIRMLHYLHQIIAYALHLKSRNFD